MAIATNFSYVRFTKGRFGQKRSFGGDTLEICMYYEY